MRGGKPRRSLRGRTVEKGRFQPAFFMRSNGMPALAFAGI
jgi:hypothetical protein